jgi:hypothetical protein
MSSDAAAFHCTVVECKVAAAQAFAFLADGLALGRWALGAWETVPVGGGVVRGRSLFDELAVWVRPVADPSQQRIDYYVGSDPDALVPRITAWVEAMSAANEGGERCRIGLRAERGAMDDARWLRLVRCHEVEILLIAARLELAAARPGGASQGR